MRAQCLVALAVALALARLALAASDDELVLSLSATELRVVRAGTTTVAPVTSAGVTFSGVTATAESRFVGATPGDMAAAFRAGVAAYNASAIELAAKLTDRTWMYVAVPTSPLLIFSVSFLGLDSTLRLDCGPTLQYALEDLTCELRNETASGLRLLSTARLTAPSSSGAELSSRITFPSGASWDALVPELVAVSFQRMVGLRRMTTELAIEREKNDVRASENRFAVAWVYAIVALGMAAACWFSAIWIAWLMPVFRWRPVVTWAVVLIVSVNAFSWMGGFGAWLTVMGLLALNALLTPLIYMISIRKQTRAQAQVADVTSPVVFSAIGADNSGARFAFHRMPHRLSGCQIAVLAGTFCAMVAAIVLCIIIVFSWKSNDFRVWDRRTNAPFTEFQPQLIAKTIAIMYAYEGAASTFRFDWLLQLQSRTCATVFRRTLSDSEKYKEIQKKFIALYSIDMSIFARTTYKEFKSVNDWFIRELRNDPTVRPLVAPTDSSVISSVADCRLTVFPVVEQDAKVWLKTQAFSVFELLGERIELASVFNGGSMAIFRLAPADYHRTHSPISGLITHQFKVKSTLYSVNADAMRSGSGAIFNQRIVTVIQDPAKPSRTVAFVAIGATCVGSVVMTKGVGATVERGEDWSNFQFGGSTVVVLFPPNSTRFDADLLAATAARMEMLVRVRSPVARWIN